MSPDTWFGMRPGSHEVHGGLTPSPVSQGGALPVKTKKQNGTLAGSTAGTTSLSTALLRAVLPLLVLALAILYALNR